MGTNDNARPELERQGIDDAYVAIVRGAFGETARLVIEEMKKDQPDPHRVLQAYARTLGQLREVRTSALRLINDEAK